MALEKWRQTFTVNGTAVNFGAISVWKAGTTEAVRVFDVNGDLQETAPQLYTDSEGFIEFSIDSEDYPSGQLFDVRCTPRGACSSEDIIDLKSLQILQDTEGGRTFKQIFVQDDPPVDGVNGVTLRVDDLFFDSDDNNHPYYYDGTNFVSVRDGSIAAAANWSEIVDDGGKPEDNATLGADLASNVSNANADNISESATNKWASESGADVTGNNTADDVENVTGGTLGSYARTGAGEEFRIYGDLHIRDSGEIFFYESGVQKASLYHNSGSLYLNGGGSRIQVSCDLIELTSTFNNPDVRCWGDFFCPTTGRTLGQASYPWGSLFVGNSSSSDWEIEGESSGDLAFNYNGTEKFYFNSSGDLYLDDDLSCDDITCDQITGNNITVDDIVCDDIWPVSDSTYLCGTSSRRWAQVHSDQFYVEDWIIYLGGSYLYFHNGSGNRMRLDDSGNLQLYQSSTWKTVQTS